MSRKIAVMHSAMALCMVSAMAMDVKDYRKYKRSSVEQKTYVRAYVMGLGVGMGWSNTVQEVNGGEPLFCPPGKLAITEENYLDILDAEIKLTTEHPTWMSAVELENSDVAWLLVKGLMRTFRCPFEEKKKP